MHHVTFPDGHSRPSLGLGTWKIGESARAREAEIAAVRVALELGYRVIDSAEMYGEGGAEEVVGQAVAEAIRAGTLRREELFVVSKVYPHNASRRGVPAACKRSLKRLGLEHIDLYLLHWPGSHPLAETVQAFEGLCAQGRIGMAIPKAVREAHLRENLAAAELELDADTVRAIDERFPPPRRRTPLATI